MRLVPKPDPWAKTQEEIKRRVEAHAAAKRHKAIRKEEWTLWIGGSSLLVVLLSVLWFVFEEIRRGL